MEAGNRQGRNLRIPPISLNCCGTPVKIHDQRSLRIWIPQQPTLNSPSIKALIVVILNPNVLSNRTWSYEVDNNTVSESLQDRRLEEAVRHPDRTILSHRRESGRYLSHRSGPFSIANVDNSRRQPAIVQDYPEERTLD